MKVRKEYLKEYLANIPRFRGESNVKVIFYETLPDFIDIPCKEVRDVDDEFELLHKKEALARRKIEVLGVEMEAEWC